MIISSFHTGPDRNGVIYILIIRRGHSSVSKYVLCLHMDPYVVTFHLGLGIGVIGPAFYISLVILDLFTSPLLASIESRNRFDCPF